MVNKNVLKLSSKINIDNLWSLIDITDFFNDERLWLLSNINEKNNKIINNFYLRKLKEIKKVRKYIWYINWNK